MRRLIPLAAVLLAAALVPAAHACAGQHGAARTDVTARSLPRVTNHAAGATQLACPAINANTSTNTTRGGSARRHTRRRWRGR
jgi:hypothetical protein